jgi:hypothetical protein
VSHQVLEGLPKHPPVVPLVHRGQDYH